MSFPLIATFNFCKDKKNSASGLKINITANIYSYKILLKSYFWKENCTLYPIMQ